jgi:predicted RNA binding protein YcfA (HicA-like mRNA interferase family)
MGQKEKILKEILSGKSDNNIDFNTLCKLLLSLGFNNRNKGSHRIFFKNDIEEIINIQPLGNKAKAYQVKQIRNLIIKYKLEL